MRQKLKELAEITFWTIFYVLLTWAWVVFSREKHPSVTDIVSICIGSLLGIVHQATSEIVTALKGVGLHVTNTVKIEGDGNLIQGPQTESSRVRSA